MSAIGYVAKNNDGSFKGTIRTLMVNAKITILPVTSPSPKDPHFRIFVVGNVELGAAWNKVSKQGTDHISLVLRDPSFGTLYANLGPAAGQDMARHRGAEG
jgi:uncharacterized protein (DUF736 family)